jgi:metacaspase-1
MTVKKALLVGINYKKSDYELNGCINDVMNIKEMLISEYGYKDDNILVMTDDTSIKPKCKNIIEGFKWLNSKNNVGSFSSKYKALTDNDKAKLVFCYSGHGGQLRDTNGDEIDGYDETLCPVDFLTDGMITDDFIRSNFINKIGLNTKLTCIIDACHSGTCFDLKWTLKTKVDNSFTLDKYDNYSETKGTVIMISGCKDDQTSADIQVGSTNNGALTHSLLQVLRKNKYTVSYEKLLTEVKNYIQVNKLSEQLPCMSYGKNIKINANFEF